MKNTLKKIVHAFVSNASKDGQIPSGAIGTIASTAAFAPIVGAAFLLALTFGLAGAAGM